MNLVVKTYLMNQVFISIHKSWEPNVTTIREDLRTLPFDNLLGSFVTHQMMIGEDASKNMSFKDSRKAKKLGNKDMV